MSIRHLLGICIATTVAHGASAQASAIGIWRGTSICQVRPSACRDEVAVYRFTQVGTGDSLSMDARKIVNGKEEDMGVLGCIMTNTQITCAIPNGVWHFTVRGDSLTGELRLPDNTKFRDVRAVRAR
jgi:methyl coenzyme M reductase gamma subunit